MPSLAADIASLPRLTGQAVKLFVLPLPALLATAFAGLAAVALSFALIPFLGGLAVVPIVGVIVVAHALFAIAASRLVAHRIDPKLVAPLRAGRLIGASFALSCLLLALGTFGIFLGPAVVLLVAVILAWTAVLPILALERGDLGDAIRSARCLPWRFVPFAFALSLPYLGLVGLLLLPLMDTSFGLFDGGVIAWPWLGAVIFLALSGAAVVSTLTYATFKRRAA